jgi:hypothetical protein
MRGGIWSEIVVNTICVLPLIYLVLLSFGVMKPIFLPSVITYPIYRQVDTFFGHVWSTVQIFTTPDKLGHRVCYDYGCIFCWPMDALIGDCVQ